MRGREISENFDDLLERVNNCKKKKLAVAVAQGAIRVMAGEETAKRVLNE